MLRIPPSPQPALTGTETKPCAPSAAHCIPTAALASAAPTPCRWSHPGSVGALAGMWLSSVRDRDAAARPGTAVGMGREVSAVVPACTEQAGEGSSLEREAALLWAARTRLSERVWSVKSNKASWRSPGSVAACRPQPHHTPEAAHYGASRSPELHVCYDLTLQDMK